MRTTTHLSIQNQLGSVEHYYHFLLGFLLPLVNYRYFIRADLGELLIRSCGIMDRHIQALAIPGLTIIPREKHAELAATRPGQLDYVRLEGFDSPLLHLPNELKRCRNKILLRFNRYSKRAGKTMTPAANPRILMINRLASDPFYQSDHCEIKTSGSDRRSIPNFNELTSSLSHFKPTIATLEQSSLKEQIDLLRGHDVIIAQHGAALANLVFCREGTCVIEICPREKREEFKINGDFFGVLSAQLDLPFTRIEQDSSHAKVSAPDLLAAVQRCLSHSPTSAASARHR